MSYSPTVYHEVFFESNFTKTSSKTKQIILSARLLFEARNQKKEAKEMAVIQAVKRHEEEKAKERSQAVL